MSAPGNGLLTSRGRSFVAAGVTLVLGGSLFGFPDLTRVGLLLGLLPLLVAVMQRRHSLSLSVVRTLAPTRVTVGEPATVTVATRNHGTTSSPVLLCQEHVPAALGPPPRFAIGLVGPGQTRYVRYVVRPQVRGRYRLGPLRVEATDPFSLSQRMTELGRPDEVLVRPRVEALPGRQAYGVGAGSEGVVPFVVALHGEDDASVREYRDGDDLRQVHWRATAHTGELMVRQEDRPARRRAVLLLDPRATAHSLPGPTASFEWAVGAAASILAHLADVDCTTYLLSRGTVRQERASDALRSDEGIDLLAEEGLGDDEDLAALVRAAHWAVGTGGLLIALVGDGSAEGLSAVTALRRPGAPAVAFVLDRASFAGHSPAPADVSPVPELFRQAGWTVVTVPAGTTVANAWRQARGPVRVLG